MTRFSVNLNKFALLRNARGADKPEGVELNVEGVIDEALLDLVELYTHRFAAA